MLNELIQEGQSYNAVLRLYEKDNGKPVLNITGLITPGNDLVTFRLFRTEPAFFWLVK